MVQKQLLKVLSFKQHFIEHITIRANVKNRLYYLFNDMTNEMANIKCFDPSLLEINKLSFKGILGVNIYYIKYIDMKSPDPVNIDNMKIFFI